MAGEMVKHDEANDGRSYPIGPARNGKMLQAWQEQDAAIMGSIDTTTEAGQSSYIKAQTSSDALAKHSVGQEIFVKDWLLHEIELTDPTTGETFPALRLVFITPEGKCISTTSEILIRTWRSVVRMFGVKTFNPPVMIIIKATKARVGEFLDIDRVGRVATPAKPSAKK